MMENHPLSHLLTPLNGELSKPDERNYIRVLIEKLVAERE